MNAHTSAHTSTHTSTRTRTPRWVIVWTSRKMDCLRIEDVDATTLLNDAEYYAVTWAIRDFPYGGRVSTVCNGIATLITVL